MKKKKNIAVKIMATIALLAIIIGIVGTGALVIIQSISAPSSEVTQEQLQQYIESLSGSTTIGSWQVLDTEILLEEAPKNQQELSNQELQLEGEEAQESGTWGLEFRIEWVSSEQANDPIDELTPTDIVESLEETPQAE